MTAWFPWQRSPRRPDRLRLVRSELVLSCFGFAGAKGEISESEVWLAERGGFESRKPLRIQNDNSARDRPAFRLNITITADGNLFAGASVAPRCIGAALGGAKTGPRANISEKFFRHSWPEIGC